MLLHIFKVHLKSSTEFIAKTEIQPEGPGLVAKCGSWPQSPHQAHRHWHTLNSPQFICGSYRQIYSDASALSAIPIWEQLPDPPALPADTGRSSTAFHGFNTLLCFFPCG